MIRSGETALAGCKVDAGSLAITAKRPREDHAQTKRCGHDPIPSDHDLKKAFLKNAFQARDPRQKIGMVDLRRASPDLTTRTATTDVGSILMRRQTASPRCASHTGDDELVGGHADVAARLRAWTYCWSPPIKAASLS
jgi:hypothetical protein